MALFTINQIAFLCLISRFLLCFVKYIYKIFSKLAANLYLMLNGTALLGSSIASCDVVSMSFGTWNNIAKCAAIPPAIIPEEG